MFATISIDAIREQYPYLDETAIMRMLATQETMLAWPDDDWDEEPGLGVVTLR